MSLDSGKRESHMLLRLQALPNAFGRAVTSHPAARLQLLKRLAVELRQLAVECEHLNGLTAPAPEAGATPQLETGEH